MADNQMPDRLTINGVEYVRPGIGPAADRASVHGMYDMHLFHAIKGATVDEVVARWREHNREIQPATVNGEPVADMGPSSLCPIIVLSGKTELRRVGPMVHPGGSRDECDEATLTRWITAALTDPDIPRLLAEGAQ